MKFQNVYEAYHLDFEATHEKIYRVIPGTVRIMAGRDPKEDVGPLLFKLPPAEISVLIWPKGPPHKVQVAWTDQKEKEGYLPKLQSLLVPVEGQKEVTLSPSHMNIFQVPYPGPPKFSLAWCKEKISYIRKMGFWNYLKWQKEYNDRKSELKIKEWRVECEVLLEKMVADHSFTGDEEWEVTQKWRRRYGLD